MVSRIKAGTCSCSTTARIKLPLTARFLSTNLRSLAAISAFTAAWAAFANAAVPGCSAPMSELPTDFGLRCVKS